MAEVSVAADMLQSFVRRIESLDDEILALNSDKSEVYKELKGQGFDAKVLRKLIADRRKDASERAEFETIYELYAEALGMRLYRDEGDKPTIVRAHVETVDEFDAETGEINEPRNPAPQESASDLTVPQALTGQVATHTLETANEAAGIRPNPSMSEQTAPAPVQQSDAGNSATLSGVTSPGEQRTTNILTREQGILRLRPKCQQPGACKSSGGKSHCWSCEKAGQQAGAA